MNFRPASFYSTQFSLLGRTAVGRQKPSFKKKKKKILPKGNRSDVTRHVTQTGWSEGGKDSVCYSRRVWGQVAGKYHDLRPGPGAEWQFVAVSHHSSNGFPAAVFAHCGFSVNRDCGRPEWSPLPGAITYWIVQQYRQLHCHCFSLLKPKTARGDRKSK